MIDRSIDGFTLDELREEYDWMSDFMGRMAERIRGNPDVSSLAAYVAKLEAENAKLRELAADAWGYINHTADASWTHTRRKEARDSLSDRIRELGIEVDDA